MKIRNPGDWFIATVVVICSAVLFTALALALSGTFLGRPGSVIYADFHDITGVNLNSAVKYAGANAGLVTGVDILSSSERKTLSDPRNTVRLTLSLNQSVPELPANIKASVSSETLLSEKFILLDAGDAFAEPLARHSIIQGVTPTSFDQLVRNADAVMSGIHSMLGGASGTAGSLFLEVRGLLNDARGTLGEVRPVIATLKGVAEETQGLVSENRQPITRAITGMESTAVSLQTFANRGTQILADNEKNLTTAVTDFKVTSQNAKVATTYARILALRLAQNPSQLVWGTKTPPPLPTMQEILNAPKPLPQP
jgi:ABC-type transporter Mla subunit MlaD